MRYLVLVAMLFSGCDQLRHECAYSMGLCSKPTELMVVNGAKLHWDKSNLPVPLEYGPLGNDAIFAYRQAAYWINKQAGCTIFADPEWAVDARKGAADLTCYNGIDVDEGLSRMNVWNGDRPLDSHRWETTGPELEDTVTQQNDKGLITEAKVVIPCATAFQETQTLIAVHELLHVLGLDHDRELNTVLYPFVQGAGLHLQEKDLAYLRNYYCGKDSYTNY